MEISERHFVGTDESVVRHQVRNAAVPSPAVAVKVLVLTRYGRMGPSSRIRFQQFIDSLGPSERSGIEFEIAPLLASDYLQRIYADRHHSPWYLARAYAKRLFKLASAGRYDVIWIEKELFPGLPAFAERLLGLAGARLAVDLDDATFVFYERNRSFLIRTLMHRKMDHVFRAASVVMAGNKFLAVRAEQAGARKVVIVPTVVDMSRSRSQVVPLRANGPFTIGWIGTPSNATYLQIFAQALADAERRHGARFVTLGAPANSVPGVVQTALQWSEEAEVAEIANWHVALAPLAFGPWELGKCGYKVLQCMAAGLPVIASPIGVIPDIIRHRENGFLAKDAAECSRILDELVADPELGRRVGVAARSTVAAKFNLETWKPVVRDVLMNAVRESDGASEPLAAPTARKLA